MLEGNHECMMFAQTFSSFKYFNADWVKHEGNNAVLICQVITGEFKDDPKF